MGREGNSNLSNYISQCDKGHSLASQVCQRWKKKTFINWCKVSHCLLLVEWKPGLGKHPDTLVQQLSMGLQRGGYQFDLKKIKRFFVFFIPEVQCIFFFTSAEMKGGEMKSILDEVKPWDLLGSSSPLARLQASGNLASATGWIWRWKPPAWAQRWCRRCIGRPQGQDSLTSRLFLALVREIPQHLSYWQLTNIIKSICLSQKKYVILYLQTRLQVVVSYT